jgi:hypothetical protein
MGPSIAGDWKLSEELNTYLIKALLGGASARLVIVLAACPT